MRESGVMRFRARSLRVIICSTPTYSGNPALRHAGTNLLSNHSVHLADLWKISFSFRAEDNVSLGFTRRTSTAAARALASSPLTAYAIASRGVGRAGAGDSCRRSTAAPGRTRRTRPPAAPSKSRTLGSSRNPPHGGNRTAGQWQRPRQPPVGQGCAPSRSLPWRSRHCAYWSRSRGRSRTCRS